MASIPFIPGKPKSINITSGLVLSIIFNPSIASSASPTTSISTFALSAHLRPTLVNLKSSTITPPERSIPKEIPVKIFAASYDEKSLIFIKSRIRGNKFNLLLKLLENTSDKISNINIKREDDDGLNISVEYTVPNNEKEEFIEIIQKYSWD